MHAESEKIYKDSMDARANARAKFEPIIASQIAFKQSGKKRRSLMQIIDHRLAEKEKRVKAGETSSSEEED